MMSFTEKHRQDEAEQGGIWDLIRRHMRSLGADTGESLRDDLISVLNADEQARKLFSPTERTMLRNILRFSELCVEDVMVPRADIIAVEDEIRLDELLELFRQAGHSRLPVFHETLDDPRGFIHIKDLMVWITSHIQKQNGHSLVDLSCDLASLNVSRQMLYVPPSMRIADLLLKMQSGRIHMALVIDEYGGTDGLVSIEDLVEEIVGEIEDEHDTVNGPMITSEGKGHYLADARAPVEDLESLLGLDLLPRSHEEDVDTLGGLVFSLVGRVPVRGELILHPTGIEFEVLEGDLRRIKRLRIHVKPASAATDNK